MPKDIFKKHARLSKDGRKYCSCLLSLRDKGVNSPYGICTHSVYVTQGKERHNVDCQMNYNYDKLNMKQLKSLAREKKVSYKNKKTKKDVSKKILVNRLIREVGQNKSDYYHSLKKKAKTHSRKNHSKKKTRKTKN